VSGQPSQQEILGPDRLQSLASALPPCTLLGREADVQNGELVLSRRYSSEESRKACEGSSAICGLSQHLEEMVDDRLPT
jgi:hypothetical protein